MVCQMANDKNVSHKDKMMIHCPQETNTETNDWSNIGEDLQEKKGRPAYYPFKKYVESEMFFFFSLLSKRDVT